MNIGNLAERLIRIKDGLSSRMDRDTISEAVNALYQLRDEVKAPPKPVSDAERRAREMNAELPEHQAEVLRIKGMIE